MESDGQLNVSTGCVGNLSNVGDRRLQGKVAIVTGGVAGIGEAIIQLFIKHGAKVIIANVAKKTSIKLEESLSPTMATYAHCDVSKEEDVSAVVDVAMDKYDQLDIMYNNAGTNDNFLVKRVAEYDMEKFDRVMNVNVKGVMHDIKHVTRMMIPRKKGCIISTTSVAGILEGVAPYSYTTSKHAILGFTKNGAAALGKYGIRVNMVSPYGVATTLAVQYFKQGDASSIFEKHKAPMEGFCNSIANLQGHAFKAEDIAEAGVYLVSDESKYVSGHNLVVDGGFTVVKH